VRIFALILSSALLGSALVLAGCSISEEVKRIDQVNQAKQRQDASRSDDLTGSEIFYRSCNTCHPGGKLGTGPALDKLAEHFPNDNKLIQFIRSGKGMMPAQPKTTINDKEMASLVAYLRQLNNQ
jgi:mono/diheme cytochrome c family protein